MDEATDGDGRIRFLERMGAGLPGPARRFRVGRRTQVGLSEPYAQRVLAGLLLLIGPGDNGSAVGIDHVVRAASFEARVLQLVVYVPPIRFQRQPDLI